MITQPYDPLAAVAAALLHPLRAHVQDSMRTQAILRSSAHNALGRLMRELDIERNLIVSYGSMQLHALADELDAWRKLHLKERKFFSVLASKR